MENLMNADGTLNHGDTSVISLGAFVITSSVNDKVNALAEGVFFEKVDFTFSGGNAEGCDDGTVTGAGSVLATSAKVKDDSDNAVMREGDETVTGPFQCTLSGVPVSLGNQPVKIDSAGQTKVKSN